MDWIYFLDLFGTFVFAISGVTTAINKKFDLVGTLVIGFVTAIGGGSIRDLLIGNTPVGWLNDRNYFIAIIAAYCCAYLFKHVVMSYRKSFFLFDTIGIGLFTILGINASLASGLNPEICLIMGVISACFGGVIRDVLTNEIPLIFRKEIYASACFLGGLIYLLLRAVSDWENVNVLTAMAVVMLVRYLSIRRGWSLNFS
ncbi:MAG: trimeric intracellular cation channel family protein [Saprospiraceae bacterium]|nr:trimeric intracellular cation channel family protein [Saprospiraceae bacterium]